MRITSIREGCRRLFRPVFSFLFLVLTSLISAAPVLSAEQATIASSLCLDCHEEAAETLKGTPYDPATNKLIGCVDCHKGPTTAMHLDDPEAAKPIIPAHLPADGQTAFCTSCHKDPHSLNLYERDPHIDARVSCTDCHTIHSKNEHGFLLKRQENSLCLDCHPTVRSNFALPSHHPVMEGVVACRNCHAEIAQSPKRRSVGGPGETCVACHGRMQGPFPFEHDAAVDYSVNDGGCVNCHNPHGSTFPMLLKQSYEMPNFSLCSQCHMVPPKHQNNLQHGTQWAGMACNECHTDIHGSYTSPHLLDPSMQSQGCLKSGCHQ